MRQMLGIFAKNTQMGSRNAKELKEKWTPHQTCSRSLWNFHRRPVEKMLEKKVHLYDCQWGCLRRWRWVGPGVCSRLSAAGAGCGGQFSPGVKDQTSLGHASGLV